MGVIVGIDIDHARALVALDDGQLCRVLSRHEWGASPADQALVELRRAVEQRVERLGHEVEGVVLAVPARASDDERQEIRDQARRAGWAPRRVTNRSTLACLGAGLLDPGTRRVLVCDFAHDALEVVALEIDDSIAEVRAATSDARLASTALAGQRALSGPQRDRLDAAICAALDLARMTPDTVSEALLVGDLSCHDDARAALARRLPWARVHRKNSAELVALGAARLGALLSGHTLDLVSLRVTSRSLGVLVRGGLVRTLVPRISTAPSARSFELRAPPSTDDEVLIRVVSSERPLASASNPVATLALPRAGRAGEVRVRLSVEHDFSGNLTLTAEDIERGLRVRVKRSLEHHDPPPDAEFERRLREAEAHKIDDAPLAQRASECGELADGPGWAEELR